MNRTMARERGRGRDRHGDQSESTQGDGDIEVMVSTIIDFLEYWILFPQSFKEGTYRRELMNQNPMLIDKS